MAVASQRSRNVTAGECVMVGDDVRKDVGGARVLGIRGALLQTGKYRRGDEHSLGERAVFVTLPPATEPSVCNVDHDDEHYGPTFAAADLADAVE